MTSLFHQNLRLKICYYLLLLFFEQNSLVSKKNMPNDDLNECFQPVYVCHTKVHIIPYAAAIIIFDDITPPPSLTLLMYNCSFQPKLSPNSNGLPRGLSRNLHNSSRSSICLCCLSSFKYPSCIDQTVGSLNWTFNFHKNVLAVAEMPCSIAYFPIYARSLRLYLQMDRIGKHCSLKLISCFLPVIPATFSTAATLFQYRLHFLISSSYC